MLPTTLKVTLSTKETKEWGGCKLVKNGCQIQINWKQGWEVIETFLLPHEYAHVRAWGRMQAGIESHDDHYYLELKRVDDAAETMWPHTMEE